MMMRRLWAWWRRLGASLDELICCGCAKCRTDARRGYGYRLLPLPHRDGRPDNVCDLELER
jgi:hypothetical protein